MVVALQLILAGLLVTTPLPLPVSLTVSVWLGPKVAETPARELMVTVQAPLPLHAPPHPAKLAPTAAVGVSVTGVPAAKLAAQVVPQLIPAGALDTEPGPVSTTVSG